jgi:homoserine O-acetyltransferase
MAKIFSYTKAFHLESGRSVPQYQLAYTSYGRLNPEGNNVVWVFHALTANSDAIDWWPGLAGEGKLFDPARYFIICVNIPGSCYGTTGPLDINPETQQPWFHEFPYFTTRDMIRAYQPLRDSLGIRHIHIGIGGSMGGQQLLEWAIEEPSLFRHVVLLATNAVHSAWGRAFNASQRHAIENDSSWKQRQAAAGMDGMIVARGIALLSYRNYNTYATGQAEDADDKTDHFKAESYQRYQGVKLSRRFNAFSYYFLSKSMDAHNVGRGRGGVATALQRVKAKTLLISISSDILFPPGEQEFIAEHIPGAIYQTIDSAYGHDGFLLEYDQISAAISEFVDSDRDSVATPAPHIEFKGG